MRTLLVLSILVLTACSPNLVDESGNNQADDVCTNPPRVLLEVSFQYGELAPETKWNVPPNNGLRAEVFIWRSIVLAGERQVSGSFTLQKFVGIAGFDTDCTVAEGDLIPGTSWRVAAIELASKAEGYGYRCTLRRER